VRGLRESTTELQASNMVMKGRQRQRETKKERKTDKERKEEWE
jgi:hypothetical protein